AEDLKLSIGSAYPYAGEGKVTVRGRNLLDSLPKNVEISAEDIREALEDPLTQIVETVRTTLEKTPPELASDIVDRGIVLTGGGALLKGLDQLLREETSLPITVVDDPLSTVVMGTGKALDNLNILKEVCID
ncbi:MAG: rod shape-determining protein, partial [Desulfovibrionaceae bacterium]|nr:rod shape-determining protein [Desulfovibrionaceae bacterium]